MEHLLWQIEAPAKGRQVKRSRQFSYLWDQDRRQRQRQHVNEDGDYQGGRYSMARTLIVLSGSDHWTLSDGTRHPTGFWAEEFVDPHRTFRHAEVDVDIPRPGGLRPTVDQVSFAPDRAGGEGRAAERRSYLESLEHEFAAPRRVSSF